MVNGLPDATRVLFVMSGGRQCGVLLRRCSPIGSGSRVWSTGWLISAIGTGRRTRAAR